MTTLELKKLYALAEQRLITHEQLELVLSELTRAQLPWDKHAVLAMMNILATARDAGYASGIELFLNAPDRDLQEEASRLLWSDWEKDTPYADLILRWIKGFKTDPYGYEQLSAIEAAGEYLAERNSPDLLAALLDFFEDNSNDDVSRKAAYEAIVQAMGGDWRQLYRVSMNVSADEVADATILQAARDRLKAEGGPSPDLPSDPSKL